MDTDARLIYFSNVTANTHKFAQKLDMESARIPIHIKQDGMLYAHSPYVLIVPTYGDGTPKNAVPPQVKAFLNVESNRSLIRGVIGAGNINFGPKFAKASEVVSYKCHVPLLYRFELIGTPSDVQKVTEGLDEFWSIAQSENNDHHNGKKDDFGDPDE